MDDAKRTFNRAMRRSINLYNLGVGFENQRERKVRADWAQRFKSFMRWKRNEKIQRIDGDELIVILREECHLKSRHFTETSLSDLHRASLVMAVSAMDAYFHAKIVKHVIAKSKAKSPPKALVAHKVSVGDFIAGTKSQRPGSKLRSAIERNLGILSYQNPERIAEGLSLLGIEKFWVKVAESMGIERNALVSKVARIVKRRNQIAHEGDIFQSDIAKNRSRGLSSDYAYNAITFIQEFINHADLVIADEVR